MEVFIIKDSNVQSSLSQIKNKRFLKNKNKYKDKNRQCHVTSDNEGAKEQYTQK